MRYAEVDYAKGALRLHAEWKGELGVSPKMEINTRNDLSLAYTPGIAAPCLEIEKGINKSYELTGRGNLVAVVISGTVMLGLGDIGPETGVLVMEGKCVLFKEFGGVDAALLYIESRDVDEIAHTVALLSGSFGDINLKNIVAPRCFEIEARLKELCDIPVFHNDQHGAAIVTVAALLNAVKLTGKDIGDLRIVISDAGSAGIATARLLLEASFGGVILCNSKGSIYRGREGISAGKKEVAELTNKGLLRGSSADAMKGNDIFIGVSTPDVVSEAMVASMNEKPVVLPMANPMPEIIPDKAKHTGVFVVGARYNGFVSQINDVLAFPGIFRGALDVHAGDISEKMKAAAAYAIVSLVRDKELSIDYIIPNALNKEMGAVIVKAVAQAARGSGAARIQLNREYGDQYEIQKSPYFFMVSRWRERAVQRNIGK